MRKTFLLVVMALLLGLQVRAEIKTGEAGPTATYSLNTETGVMTISGTGVVNKGGLTAPWKDDISLITKIVVEEGITSIVGNVFRDHKSVTEVSLPKTLTAIGSFAFSGCNKLTSINIPEGIKRLEEYTFSTNAFSTIKLPESLEYIGNAAFFMCSNLTSITIPKNVREIGKFAFSSCPKLASLHIPAGVTTIGYGVAERSYALTSITVAPANLNYCAEEGVLFDKEKTLLIQYPANKPGAAYIIPHSVKELGEKCFAGSLHLTQMDMPNTITKIGADAFMTCDNLTSLKFSENITEFPFAVVRACSKLRTLVLPAGITSIGGSFASSCTALKTIVLGNPNPDSITVVLSNFLAGHNKGNIDLIVPSASVEAYKNTEPWKDFRVKAGYRVGTTCSSNQGIVTQGGNTVTGVTAFPNPGYVFTNWTTDGTVISTDNPYTPTGNMILTANFRAIGSDATLSTLTVSPGTLSPTFKSATLAYTATVDYATAAVTLGATATDANAQVFGIGEKALLVGKNVFLIDVLAEDGNTKKQYSVAITRQEEVLPPPATDATLSALTLSAGSLSPAFSPATLAYTATVDYATTAVTLSATPSDAKALVIAGAETYDLAVGTNVFQVVAVAEDAQTVKIYTVTIVRQGDPSQLSSVESAIDIEVYPNPSTSTLNLRHNAGSLDRVEIINMSGHSIWMTENMTGNTIDVSGLNAGLYLLRVINNNETSVLKFNKQ